MQEPSRLEVVKRLQNIGNRRVSGKQIRKTQNQPCLDRSFTSSILGLLGAFGGGRATGGYVWWLDSDVD